MRKRLDPDHNTSAYVSIRQHTPAAARWRMLTYADVCLLYWYKSTNTDADLMRKCLDPNPKTRAHASDLLKHDFVRIFLFFILQFFFSPARLRTSSKTLLKNTILCALPLPVPLRPKSVFGSDGPLTRPLHATYKPLTGLLHASYTPLTRLLHASSRLLHASSREEPPHQILALLVQKYKY